MSAPKDCELFTRALCDALKTSTSIPRTLSEPVKKADARQALLELTRVVGGGSLPAEKLVEALALIPDFQSIAGEEGKEMLADAVWFAWLEADDIAREDIKRLSKENLIKLSKVALRKDLLSKELLMQLCEGDFMEQMGLVVSYRDSWRKKEIRSNTRAVYTQRKFNLLREESEGWAKMTTILNQAGSGRLVEDRIGTILEEIKSLIGFFDLDPNRVCSVWLDAFSSQPQNDTFLRLSLAFSPDAIVQLLGFHFTRERPIADGLYTIAAKLIDGGIIELEPLLSHLSPSDDELQRSWKEGKDNFYESVQKIGVISLASVAMEPEKGPQSDDGHTSTHSTVPRARAGRAATVLDLDSIKFLEKSWRYMESEHQKVRLLAELIRCETWPSVQRLIKWLASLGIEEPAAFPDVGKALCEILAREIRPLYRQVYGSGLTDHSACVMLERTSKEIKHLPISFSSKIMKVLKFLGLHLYHDISTLTRLIRVTASILQTNDTRTAEYSTAVDVLNAHIMPAQALVPSNPALVLELWNALQHLSYTERYCLYSDLHVASKGNTVSACLLTASAKLAETEVRRILRRVTAPANRREAKTTMRPLGRMLAKIAHSSPFAVAEQLLRQVMGMPGMVLSISQALKFLTPLAFDVITFYIIRRLALPGRKLKEDGINLEEWFQWLAAFIGQLCRKHEEIEITAILQYLCNQLKIGESLDLLVLQEMLSAMVGISPVHDVSREQLDALAGSDRLRTHVFSQQMGDQAHLNDRSRGRNTERLMNALFTGSDEQQIAVPLLVLLAQQRRLVALQPASQHLKTVTEIFDKVQEALVAYSSFLKRSLSSAQYASLVPPLKELGAVFAIEPEISFDLHRPMLRGALISSATEEGALKFVEAPTEVDKSDPVENEEGEIATETNAPPYNADGSTMDTGTEPHMDANKEVNRPVEFDDVEDGEVSEGTTTTTTRAVHDKDECTLRLTWEEMKEEASVFMPSGGLSGITKTLYVAFWSLELSDLFVPRTMYSKVVSDAQNRAKAARDDLAAARREAQRPHFGAPYGGYSSYPSHHFITANPIDVEATTKEAERMEDLAARLPEDMKSQERVFIRADAFLKSIREDWVCDKTPEVEAKAVQEFVQRCLLPRLLISPEDAVYCARFLAMAQPLAPPGFRLLVVLDRVFRDLGFLVRCATAREAANLGVFFSQALSLVTHWRDPTAYANECSGKEGFKHYTRGVLTDIPYKKFLRLCANWQKSLTLEVFRTCLVSADYMQMRNALLTLNKMVGLYPATAEDAKELLDCLEPVAKKDPREDLKTLARMYCTALQGQMRGLPGKDKTIVATRDEYAGLKPKQSRNAPAALKMSEQNHHDESSKMSSRKVGEAISSKEEDTSKKSRNLESKQQAQPDEDASAKRKKETAGVSSSAILANIEQVPEREIDADSKIESSKQADEERKQNNRAVTATDKTRENTTPEREYKRKRDAEDVSRDALLLRGGKERRKSDRRSGSGSHEDVPDSKEVKDKRSSPKRRISDIGSKRNNSPTLRSAARKEEKLSREHKKSKRLDSEKHDTEHSKRHKRDRHGKEKDDPGKSLDTDHEGRDKQKSSSRRRKDEKDDLRSRHEHVRLSEKLQGRLSEVSAPDSKERKHGDDSKHRERGRREQHSSRRHKA